MKENKYFKLDEFKCKCGKCEMPENMPSDELVDLLVEIREYYDKPVKIKSGYRCKEHNRAVGGAPRSRHLVGDAADFIVRGVLTKEVYEHVIKTYNDRGCGIAICVNESYAYAGFVHLDTRGYKARWGYNAAGREFVTSLTKKLGIT